MTAPTPERALWMPLGDEDDGATDVASDVIRDAAWMTPVGLWCAIREALKQAGYEICRKDEQP